MEKIREVKNQSENSHRELSARTSKRPKNISYGQLGALLFAFIIGIVVALLFVNLTKSEKITFSTTGLVSFLFSIALAGASIVLAITAISLSKASERAMIDRSDESIRLQNEVFIKTTDALQRIESSTGVTEKRIEDIISGRAGDISQKVVEHALDEKLITNRSRQLLEAEIKQSLLSQFSELKSKESQEAIREKQKKRVEARKNYAEFKDAILLGIANSKTVKLERIGDGSFFASSDALVDGVFITNGIRFGVSTFATNVYVKPELIYEFSSYISKLAYEISKGTFARVFMAFDCDPSKDDAFKKQLLDTKALVRQDIIDKLIIVSGSAQDIIKQILGKIEQNSTS
jgi:hypothetical protein